MVMFVWIRLKRDGTPALLICIVACSLLISIPKSVRGADEIVLAFMKSYDRRLA